MVTGKSRNLAFQSFAPLGASDSGTGWNNFFDECCGFWIRDSLMYPPMSLEKGYHHPSQAAGGSDVTRRPPLSLSGHSLALYNRCLCHCQYGRSKVTPAFVQLQESSV